MDSTIWKPLKVPLILDVVGCIVNHLAHLDPLTAALLHPSFTNAALDILYDNDDFHIVKISRYELINALIKRIKAKERIKDTITGFQILRFDSGAKRDRKSCQEQAFAIECFKILQKANFRICISHLELAQFNWLIYEGSSSRWPAETVEAVRYVFDLSYNYTILDEGNFDQFQFLDGHSIVPQHHSTFLLEPSMRMFNSLVYWDEHCAIHCFMHWNDETWDASEETIWFEYGIDYDSRRYDREFDYRLITFILLNEIPQSECSLTRDESLETRWKENREMEMMRRCEITVKFFRYSYTKDLNEFQRIDQAKRMMADLTDPDRDSGLPNAYFA